MGARRNVATWAIALHAAACGGSDPPFDPRPYVGEWRGRWVDDRGRRGAVDLTATAMGGGLELTYDVRSLAIPGLRPATERLHAEARGAEAVVEAHRSDVLGEVTATIDSEGVVTVDCDGVPGPIAALYANGRWTAARLKLFVDVRYDDDLLTSEATVELELRGRD